MEREDDAAATPASPIESETKPPRVESDEKETRNDPNQTPRSESQMSQTSQTSLQQLTDRALHFLSTASNETIGACLVGLGAGTYLVLGRVGLVLIGVVGGVVLHATWEGGSGATGDASKAVEERRRKEVGLDVIHRVLNWRSHKKEDEGDSALLKVDAITLKEEDLKFMKFKPETAEALRQITDAVIRDYVKWWYSPILPQELQFPAACRETLTSFILSISNNLSRKRPANSFVDFVMNTSSIMTIFFGELSSALGASPSSSPADAVGTYVELKPDSSLARLLDREEQHRKLSLVAEDILQTYLDHKVYNCSPAHVFLKQILANTVIDMTINSCSRPEWINDWIVYLLEEGEPELLKEVDAGLEGQTGDAVKNVEEEVAITDAKPNALKKSSKAQASHRRVVSRGQEAFDEAMQEAARLTRLMQEEDARLAEQRGTAVQHPLREPPNSAIEDSAALAAAGAMGMIDAGPMIPASNTNNANDDQSESTTQGIVTPTSSQSDRNHGSEGDSDRGISTESHRRDTGLPTSPSDNAPSSGFTSFDQIMPQAPPAAFGDNSEGSRQERDPLTLYNCNITIFDDSVPGDRAAIKTKPILDYLIQIEPASSQHPGWMIAKTYVDIEKLHESIRPLSKITGAGFDKTHTSVPGWKGQTKSQLREALERYLNDAVRSKQLAETEVMKRFFEKDQNLTKSPSGKVGINSAFETVGKGVTGGGKALIGGVAGVFGAMGPKRGSTSSSNPTGRTRSNAGSPSPHNRSESVLASTGPARQSADSLRRTTSNANPRQNSSSPIEGRPSITPEPDANARPRPVSPARSSILSQTSPPASRPSSIRESGEMSAAHGGDQIIHLPPLPSEIQDDYATSDITAAFSNDTDPIKSRAESILTASTAVDPFSETPLYDSKTPLSETPIDTQPPPLPKMPSKEYPPLTEKETQDAIELLFAVITELYTLSSAWSLRRTLLTAAKSFLLRPGNPQLESIRQLLQSTVLDANTSDAGMATHLRKLRENSLPTEAELAAWPKEPSEKEKEELRVKARKLLVERGMPVALTSVMGQAASGEALGRVFDCLQVKEVARGLMFGLMLQGIRVVVQ